MSSGKPAPTLEKPPKFGTKIDATVDAACLSSTTPKQGQPHALFIWQQNIQKNIIIPLKQ